MLLVPSESSKPLPISLSIIGLKARFLRFSSFFLSTSLRRAIPVLQEPLELVFSQVISAWVKDVQQQGQKKKQDRQVEGGGQTVGMAEDRHSPSPSSCRH